jgi:hypothetical protein
MKYLILKTPLVEYAQAISRFIYGMSIPTFSEVTQYYCSWIKHPETNEVALAFNENDSLPISAEANPVLLVDTIRAAITASEATELENLIANSQSIKPIEHIPASLASNIKTEAEMEAGRWFRPIIFLDSFHIDSK